MKNLLAYTILFLIVLVVSFVVTKIEVGLVNKKRISTGNHEIIQGKAFMKKFLLMAGITGVGAIIGLLTYTQGWLN